MKKLSTLTDLAVLRISIGVLIFLALWIALEIYLGRRLKKHLKSYDNPNVYLVFIWVYRLINIGFWIMVFGRQFIRNVIGFPIYAYTPIINISMMSIVMTKFILFLFIAATDIRQWIRKKRQKVEESPTQLSRRKFIINSGLVTAALPVMGMWYGFFRGKYAFQLHEVELAFKDLPEAFDGFKVVQFSDFHAGSFDQTEPVLEGLKMISNLKPDLLLFTGDMVNYQAEEVEPWHQPLQELTAPFGKFSVLGNHDYGSRRRRAAKNNRNDNVVELMKLQQKMGFDLLLNDSTRIEKDGQFLNLIGVENWGKPPFPQFGDLEQAFSKLPEDGFNLLMSHDPSHWEAQILPFDRKVHLTLSGHTHGAQLGVELPWMKASPVQFIYPQWAGLYEKEDQYIYVNRGFGFIGISLRMGIWPEITQITLRKA
ncbi:MAG: metallophosphoesterase [Bacteroidota bacterium]